MITRSPRWWLIACFALLVAPVLALAQTAPSSKPAPLSPPTITPVSAAVAPEPVRKAAPALEIPRQTKINSAWQVALDGASFSPGVIDGHFGRKGQMALSEYAARFFPGLNLYDVKVFTALKVDVDHAVSKYTITADDAAQIGVLPEDWNEKAKLERLPYESLDEMIAEKFHCTRALLAQLNTGVKMEQLDVGQELNVPNIRPWPTDNKVHVTNQSAGIDHLEVNLAEKTIRAFDKDNQQAALFHCSVAKDKAKLPAADTAVKSVAPNPEYWFDPKHWPEVKTVTSVLKIPPGPRNPVGLAWVGLVLDGYGMHGTPKPELIGKTGSHGCFRLTNWEAIKLACLVRVGMVVKIVNPEKPGTP